ncbi:MAG: cell division protein ZapA [Alphaproteobacteria bacterium]
MAQVTLKINDRSYEMTCDDGQEDHLRKLAAHVDERMQELAESVGQVGEARLLIMASLLITDELYDAHRQIDALDDEGEGADNNGAADSGELELEFATALESGAERIEALAVRLGAVENHGA